MAVRRDLPPKPFPLEVTGIAGMADRGFAAIRARPGVVLGAVATVVVPAVVLGGLATGTHAGDESASPFTWDVGDEAVGLLGLGAALVLDSLATFAAGILVARIVVGWFAGEVRDIKDAYVRFPWLGGLAACLLVGLTQLIGFMACAIGVLVPMAFFMLVAPVMAIESLGPLAAMSRSWRLASRRPVQMIGLLLAVLLIGTMVTIALNVVPWLLMDPLPGPVRAATRFALSAASGTVVTAFAASVATVAYLQLRIRTEGLDLELSATDAFPKRP